MMFSLVLQPRQPTDEAFLRQLYALSREDEFAQIAWDEDQKHAFINQQFDLQEQAYQTDYAGCQDFVILADGQPAGRLLTYESEGALCLLDIAVLPELRSRGIGSYFIRQVMARGTQTGKLVWLYVLITNERAQSLYQRLGFTRRERVSAFYVMDWQPAAS